jgi:nucleoside transporter
MSLSIRIRLSIMMFLQYFVWGAWYVTMSAYLNETVKFDGPQIGLAYGTTALAAMISPFFVGLIADRFFATEKLLAVLHLLGGLLLFYVATLTSFGPFYTALMAYTLCYMPTLALTNSLSFHQMTDPGKQFPSVRVLGTIGWIIASFVLDALGYSKSSGMFMLAAISSLVLGVFCFTLPHTPPSKLGHAVTIRDILGLDALALMKSRSFAIFIRGSSSPTASTAPSCGCSTSASSCTGSATTSSSSRDRSTSTAKPPHTCAAQLRASSPSSR